MKKFIKKSSVLLAVLIVFGLASSSLSIVQAAMNTEVNQVNATVREEVIMSEDNQSERVKVAEFDFEELQIGKNEIYNDGETVVSLDVEVPIEELMQPNGGSSGWSGGTIPPTATLHPHKSVAGGHIKYTLFWHNRRIDSVHSIDYRVLGGTVTNTNLDIIRANPGASPAMAIGEVHYVMTQGGITPGSYNDWLRTEINSSDQFRLVWNY